MTVILLRAVFSATLGWFALKDGAEYRRFKAFADIRDQQRGYGLWPAKSWPAFGGGSLLVIATTTFCIMHLYQG